MFFFFLISLYKVYTAIITHNVRMAELFTLTLVWTCILLIFNSNFMAALNFTIARTQVYSDSNILTFETFARVRTQFKKLGILSCLLTRIPSSHRRN